MKNIFVVLKNRFLKGLFIILPIGVTVWVAYKAFTFSDAIIGRVLYPLIDKNIPGLGLLITLLVVYLVGTFASNLVGKKMTESVEFLFEHTPIIKTIYLPLKDFTKNFTNKESSNFKKVAMLVYPVEGSYSIGFITKENIQMNGKTCAMIFVPTTPNPTNGLLMLVEEGKYEELDMPVDDALKSIISLGSITPDHIELMNKTTSQIV